MKKIIKYLFLLTGGSFILTSCNDFLDREPLDSVTPDNFFFTENDLAAYAVKHYNFTTHEGFNAGIWKNDNAATKYDIKEAEEKDSSYQVTVETQQMQLYTAMEPVYNEKLADYPKNNSVDSDQYIEDGYTLMLEAYQSALDTVTYSDPQEVTVTLQKDDSDLWSISSDDMTT